jgi:enoyl-CoA hydratase
LAQAMPGWARDPEIYAFVMQNAPVAAAGSDAEAVEAAYRLAWRLECFSKPTVSLLDGEVSAFGMGLALCGTHRVAGKRFRLHLGIDDVVTRPVAALGHYLAQLPDSLGIYAALCMPVIDQAEAHYLGLVTHCIDDARFSDIEMRLADADTVDPVLDLRHSDPGSGKLAEVRTVIARCFSAASIAEITGNLDRETGDVQSWAQQTATLIRSGDAGTQSTILTHLLRLKSLDRRSALIVSHKAISRVGAKLDLPTRGDMQSLRSTS